MANEPDRVFNQLTALGFSMDAATHIVNEEGYDNRRDYLDFDDDQCSRLCKTVRKPGGADANGNLNVGTMVSMKAEGNLKLFCFYLRHRIRTSRPLDIVPPLSQADARKFTHRVKEEADHVDPSPPTLGTTSWTRTFETLEDYFRKSLGVTKIPLAYVIRDQVEPKAHADDPSTNYSNDTEEMIARAPHFEPAPVGGGTPEHTDAYKQDNNTVFDKLAELFREKACWTYMRGASRKRDGRLAYLSLKGHYLGKSNVDNMATAAETQLQNTTYNGDTRRWNFERYVATQVEQHHILTDLTRHGYAGIDPRSKVRYLMNGIKTKELDSVKTQIMADPKLRTDFDAAVNLYQDYIRQTKAVSSEPRHANIGAIGRDSRGDSASESSKEYDQVKPDMSVEDRYYTKPEYRRLSLAKKKGLAIKREKRGHKPGARDSKKEKAYKGKKSFRKAVVAAIKQYKANKKKNDDDDSTVSSDEEVPMKDAKEQSSNRNSKALKRKHT